MGYSILTKQEKHAQDTCILLNTVGQYVALWSLQCHAQHTINCFEVYMSKINKKHPILLPVANQICDLLWWNREQVGPTSVWFYTVAGINIPYLFHHPCNHSWMSSCHLWFKDFLIERQVLTDIQLSHLVLTIPCYWQIETVNLGGYYRPVTMHCWYALSPTISWMS